MKEFLELMEQNEELKKKVKELDARGDSQPSDYIALAAEYGISIQEADFQSAKSNELSDDELDAIAGGDTCGCGIGGGGKGNEQTGAKTCGCAVGGAGLNRDNKARCVCVVGGVGEDNWVW